MVSTMLYTKSVEVGSRLADFGISKEELIEVAEKAAGARRSAVDHDPVNAAGLLGYIYGTRALRDLLVPRGWEVDRTENIEGTIHPSRKIRIIYQNTDSAGDAMRPPRAICGKGAGVERMVEDASAFLWPDMEEEFQRNRNAQVWFLCVALDGDDVTVELSRPGRILGRQFSDFEERVLVKGKTDHLETAKSQDDEGFADDDVDINITKK